MLRKIQDCFKLERILFTKHAKDEMEEEEFGRSGRERKYLKPLKVGK